MTKSFAFESRVPIIKKRIFPQKTTDLTIYPYEKNALTNLVIRLPILFVCRRPYRIGNDGPVRNTFRGKSR